MKSTLSRYMTPRHLKATRMLGYALVAHDEAGWQSAAAVWQVRLKQHELGAIAWAALAALPYEAASDVVTTVLGGAETPLAPLDDVIDAARFWTTYATPDEIRAYAVAAVQAMPPGDRRRFADFLAEDAA